ncbi:MAG: dihydrofolate reductase family protein [Ignavibacteriaceae bacterium]|nr:dihydrofolate reductase family protein [Ignavibacteriaceae bacterium]
MRKIIFQMMISLDGYFEGPDRQIDWHNVDAEFNDFAIAFLDSIDTLFFGRKTYELMAGYWPTEYAATDDPVVARKMNSIEKIVFSNTLTSVSWENTKLLKNNIIEEVVKIKQQAGKDIAIFGSSDLSVALMQHGLIDEFRIIINPVVLGSGKTLFEGLNNRYKLRLVDTKIFRSGNVLLCYQPNEIS